MRSTGHALTGRESGGRLEQRRPALTLVVVLLALGCADDDPRPPTSDAPAANTDVDAAAETGPLPLDAPADRQLPEAGERFLLSQTGLYSDPGSLTLSAGLLPFTPAYELWSDGADKRRFLQLPAGTQIDTSDPEHWQFPVGTRVWKEFSRAGVRLETRLIERTGPGPSDYWMGAFLWNADGTDAEYVPDGASNVNGTDHDVPSTKQCASCHGGEPGRLLGFSALQLAATGSGTVAPGTGEQVNLSRLIADGRLSDPPPESIAAPLGTPAARAALGYLHANCGHCHSPRGLAYRDVDLVLRLALTDLRVEQTGAYRTGLGVAMRKPTGGSTTRIVPGQPGQSGVFTRMGSLEPMERMPPLATEHVHAAGLKAVSDWITELR